MAVKTETRTVSGFNRVRVQGYGEVTLIQGDNEGLTIEADEELLPKIKSEVADGRLTLGFDMQWWEWLTWWINRPSVPDQPIRYRIEVINLEQFAVEGSATLDAARLAAEACELSVSGSARMKIRLVECGKLTTRISGSGKISLAGKADQHEIRVGGSGEIEADELETQQTEIHISGSGQADVNAAQKLSVDIGGAGNVRYRGQPQVEHRISGAGSIRQM